MSVIKPIRGIKEVPNIAQYNPKQARPAINIKSMNTLIFNLGVVCRIYVVSPCPNVKSIDGGEHELNCPLCKGKNLVDSDTYVESYVGFVNQSRDESFNAGNIGSLWEEGSAYGSFISGINLTYFAKIELPDFSKPFNQLVQRQDGDLDYLRYRAFKVNLLIDKNGIKYTQDVDFILQDGWIKWLPVGPGVKRPSPKTIYTIQFESMVTLRAVRAMHAGRWTSTSEKLDHTENLEGPEQWLLKLDYLVINEDNTGNIIKNKISRLED